MTHRSHRLVHSNPTTMTLPLDKVTIKLASRAQELESRRQTSVEWAQWLDVEGYLKRLASWEVLDHAANGRIITWLVVLS